MMHFLKNLIKAVDFAPEKRKTSTRSTSLSLSLSHTHTHTHTHTPQMHYFSHTKFCTFQGIHGLRIGNLAQWINLCF